MKKAFLQLHVAILLAGFTGVLGRLIHLNESLLVWYRMLFATIILFVVSLFTVRIKRLTFREMLPLLGVGSVISIHWVLFYGSVKYANISVALVCFSAVGFFSTLLEPLINQTRIDFAEFIIGLLAMLGIYLIFHFDKDYQLGIIFGIVSSFFAALFPILNKKLVDRFDSNTITFYEIGGGWLSLNILVPIYLIFYPAQYLIPSVSDFFWLIILSLFCTVLAFNLSIRSLIKVSPFTVNLSYNLEPVYGIILAFVVFNENQYLGTSFYVGLGIIFFTVLVQSWRIWITEKHKQQSS
jgi:drug/metabolite transporter (DMT)-like permease